MFARLGTLAVLFALPCVSVAFELGFSGDQRFRFESINENFRPAASTSDDLFLSRTQLKGTAKYRGHSMLVEVTDSRQWLADADTVLNTGMVNTRELTQAMLRLDYADFDIDIGRMTREDPSRRLLARNQFRNTTNTFLGVDLGVDTKQGRLRTFYLRPNQALPRTQAALRNNDSRGDRFDADRELWGVELATQSNMVLSYFYLDEDDNRQLHTLSLHGSREDLWNRWDLSWHTVLQQGEVQTSHKRAFFQRLAATLPWRKGQLTASIDYATGDDDPFDGDDDAFDSLFGVQRFEWGPGSLYNAMRRTNIISPAIRYDFKYEPASGYVTYRPVWLAEKRDAWAGTGVQDPSGRAGRFVGHQLDLRYRVGINAHVRVEIGGALLVHGSYLRRTLARANDNHTLYGYAQMSITF